MSALFGVHDENLRLLEDAFGVEISARGGVVSLSGGPEGTERAAHLLSEFSKLIGRGYVPKKSDVPSAIRIVKDDPTASLVDFFENRSVGAALRQVVAPRNVRQQEYLQAIGERDVVFAIGPAGTGKTYLAVAMAAAALLEKRVKRIVLCRPAVEAGEKLGFLPGDLAEKVNPYLRPLYDALYDILGYEKVGRLLERQVIEIAPLAFMRGRTLNDAFIVMLLTAQRMGEVCGMRWEDVDLGSAWWTIPAESSKNLVPHRVPLNAQVLEVLKRRQETASGKHVFTNDGLSSVAARAKKAASALSKGLGFSFRAHDLRRTAASYMAEAGVDRFHIAHVLNHRSVTHSTVTAIYDRYRYDKEKRVALETWAAVLSRIAARGATDDE